MVVASSSRDTALAVQAAFLHPLMRVYVSDDVVGVEIGGALKNVFAIGKYITDRIRALMIVPTAVFLHVFHQLSV